MILFFSYVCVFFLSFLFTGLLRRYALATDLIDIPNERSSHLIPTPRGGGLAFVLCFLGALIGLFAAQLINANYFLSLFVPCLLVALIGFFDDRYHLSAKWRLVGQFFAGGLALYFVGDIGTLFFKSYFWLIAAIEFCALIYLVWFLNLFNFMDGIDGLAAIESISICLGLVVIYLLDGQLQIIITPLLLAAAVAGFLIWNFPPARIFMGDVGSGFLGLSIAVFSLQAACINILIFYSQLILAAVFIVDATFTLLYRAMHGKALFKAHRSHAYQHAALYYGSHKVVTLSVLGINCIWLLPLALLVSLKYISPLSGIIIAYLPLILLARKFNAGRA